MNMQWICHDCMCHDNKTSSVLQSWCHIIFSYYCTFIRFSWTVHTKAHVKTMYLSIITIIRGADRILRGTDLWRSSPLSHISECQSWLFGRLYLLSPYCRLMSFVIIVCRPRIALWLCARRGFFARFAWACHVQCQTVDFISQNSNRV